MGGRGIGDGGLIVCAWRCGKRYIIAHDDVEWRIGWHIEPVLQGYACRIVSGLPASGGEVGSRVVSSVFRREYHLFGGGWNEDSAVRVRSLTDEEPLEIVKACVDGVWKVVRQYVLNGFDSMRGKSECTLCGDGHGGTS
jgi:hypothetical protein